MNINIKDQRKKRVRSKLFGRKKKPRVSVFRSNKHIYAQVIDDEKRVTLTEYSSLKKIGSAKANKNKSEIGFLIGEKLGDNLNKLKIKEIVFDRGCYKYHGRVKNLAEGLRSKKIKF